MPFRSIINIMLNYNFIILYKNIFFFYSHVEMTQIFKGSSLEDFFCYFIEKVVGNYNIHINNLLFFNLNSIIVINVVSIVWKFEIDTFIYHYFINIQSKKLKTIRNILTVLFFN